MTASTPPTGVAKYIATHPSFQDTRSPSSPLPALYADLSRQRKSNPAGYRASVEWWKDVLLDVTFAGLQFERDPPSSASTADATEASSNVDEVVDRTVFRLDEGTKARWTVAGVGRPLGLGTVVAELESERTLVPLAVYLKATTRVAGPAAGGGGLRQYVPTPRGVAAALLVAPARWAASQLVSLVAGSSGDDYSEDEQAFRVKRGDWVCFPLVQRLATTFLSAFYATHAAASPLACLMSPTEFHTHFTAVCRDHFHFTPSLRDTELILTFLARDHSPPLLIRDAALIKLSPSPSHPVGAITDEDRAVLTVKSTLRTLSLQITALEAQIAQRTAHIRTALPTSKPQAASHLRSRMALQTVLAKRVAVHENLSAVVRKIEQAKTDVEVMRAFRASEAVLRVLLGGEELRVENVERVMDGLAEVLGVQREVEEVMKGGVEGVDEDEVLAELRVLERDAREEEKEQKEKEEKQKQKEEQKEDKEKQKEELHKEKEKQKEHDDLQARFDRLRVAPSPLATPTPASSAQAQPNPSPSAIAE
ncbi:conserved hypothetical protein [Sporisorium reilianum SRZ2]|uniref:Uncharacterized protein n=1 Tax=Sporisorium reilianum (strain SRZ2) TaxID=999809 RepID=E6ZZD8_SPORE|nr:conserved hypothetical protein [Sporisorium reilianum SRZ2]